ncbi:BfmA/BtgA family mobilization protein [Aquimarina algiphila]|uniref:BfmA/BtgA family mobilization protein n=1 Tax=Aquimarina algiphila TaxID=2047982 RepID=UPI0024917216|nr:BfmA/BtgA family mobilization protein [Aquimarina algiphila]
MDNGYEKEQFTTISFKSSVAKKFRVFSKKMGASNSMTLLMMLDFFEVNNMSPKESIGPTVHTLENLIKKRVSAVIAILRDMEKSQTKPTVAMMQSLFEEVEPKSKPLLVEKKNLDIDEKVRFREKEL